MQRGNKDNNSIYNSIQKNKISWNRFNQGGERCVHWKLQDNAKRDYIPN